MAQYELKTADAIDYQRKGLSEIRHLLSTDSKDGSCLYLEFTFLKQLGLLETMRKNYSEALVWYQKADDNRSFYFRHHGPEGPYKDMYPDMGEILEWCRSRAEKDAKQRAVSPMTSK